MHPKIEAYIAEKEAARKAARDAEKQRFLEAENLVEFIPSPSQNNYTAEFPDWGTDPETGDSCRGKNIPIEITDEEYELLRSASGTISASNQNKVASLLRGIAYAIYGLSGLAAFIMLVSGEWYLLGSSLITLVSGLISGTFFLGFAEIIKLLQQINNKLK